MAGLPDARGLLTAEETARMIGVDVSMVRRLTDHHRLSFVAVGRMVRFRRADVERFVEEWTIAADEHSARG